MGGELRQLEKGAAGVEEHPDALAGGELAGSAMPAHGLGRSALGGTDDLSLELAGEVAHGRLIVAELLRAGVEAGGDAGHGLVTMA